MKKKLYQIKNECRTIINSRKVGGERERGGRGEGDIGDRVMCSKQCQWCGLWFIECRSDCCVQSPHERGLSTPLSCNVLHCFICSHDPLTFLSRGASDPTGMTRIFPTDRQTADSPTYVHISPVLNYTRRVSKQCLTNDGRTQLRWKLMH